MDYVNGFEDTDTFTKSFKKDFDSIVAYHGTKLNNKELNDIRTKGLMKGSKSLLHRKAIERFVLSTDSKELKQEIKNEI